MLKDVDRIIVENAKTGEKLAVITDDEITTANKDIVVRLRPVYEGQPVGGTVGMLHHYITKYAENGTLWVESWMQLNLFGRCFCFSRRKIPING